MKVIVREGWIPQLVILWVSFCNPLPSLTLQKEGASRQMIVLMVMVVVMILR